jgi:serine/threonine-protein kinase
LKKLLLLGLMLAAQACLAADYFGAIAYSTKSGANGWAKDHPSREAAERAAVDECSKHAQDCRPVLWFKNGCGALAVSSKAYGWGWGTTQKLADTEAIKACARHAKGCKVKHKVCTTGAR